MAAVITFVLVDTSDIHAFGVALRRQADDLAAVAADLTGARVSLDAFGSVGSSFVAALNDALIHEADLVTSLAGRLSAAKSSAGATANAYDASEDRAGRSISMFGG